MKTVSYMQWYNENEGRAYPISESATRTDNLSQQLPSDIVVDLSVLVPPEHADMYFSSIRITSTIVSVALRSPLSGLLIGTFPRSQVTPYKAYGLTPVVDDVSGWVVFGTHRAVVTEDYRFSALAQSFVEPKVVHVVEHLPVNRFLRYGGADSNDVTGIVELVGGNGVVITKTGLSSVTLELSAALRKQFASPCNAGVGREPCKTTPIRQIAGVCPDANGRITVRFE